MAIEIISLSVQEVEAALPQIKNVYLEAFAGPPYYEEEKNAQNFADQLERHRYYQGFRLRAARDATDGLIVGFAYGYTSRPGRFWYDAVARAFSPQAIKMWLDDAFEVVELAVAPDMQ